jgi:hypothetical protein
VNVLISDNTFRASEKRKNDALKRNWTTQFNNAKSTLDNLRSLVVEGDDFYYMILGASLREEIQVHIDELMGISDEANSLLANLENLTREGKRITGSLE